METVLSELESAYPKKVKLLKELESKLAEECIDDIGLLKACTDPFLQSLGMPMGMIIRMREIINRVEAESSANIESPHTNSAPLSEPPSVTPPIPPSTPIIPPTIPSSVPPTLPPQIPIANDAEACTKYAEDILKKEAAYNKSLECVALCEAYILHDLQFTQSPYALQDKCLKLLERIISNIIAVPTDSEKRTIYIDTNAFKSSIGEMNSQSLLDFLSAVGFSESCIHDRECIILASPNIRQLEKGLEVLRKLRSSITVSSVHAKHVRKAQAVEELTSEVASWHIRNQEDEKRLSKLKTLAKGGVYEEVDPQPTITKPQIQNSKKDKKKKEPAVDYNHTSKDLQEIRDSLNQNTTFVSKQRVELQKLQNKTIYTEISLKFVMADQSYLTVRSHPARPLGTIYDLIQPYIYGESGDNVGVDEYEIFVTPPVQVIRRNAAKTLAEMGYVPAASFRVRALGSKQLNWCVPITETA